MGLGHAGTYRMSSTDRDDEMARDERKSRTADTSKKSKAAGASGPAKDSARSTKSGKGGHRAPSGKARKRANGDPADDGVTWPSFATLLSRSLRRRTPHCSVRESYFPRRGSPSWNLTSLRVTRDDHERAEVLRARLSSRGRILPHWEVVGLAVAALKEKLDRDAAGVPD